MDTMKHMTDKVGAAAAGNNAREGEATKKIEQLTSALPSSTWLILGGSAIVGALVLKAMGRDAGASFVGQWVPTILMLGLYNKVVKVMGSDRGANNMRMRS